MYHVPIVPGTRLRRNAPNILFLVYKFATLTLEVCTKVNASMTATKPQFILKTLDYTFLNTVVGYLIRELHFR